MRIFPAIDILGGKCVQLVQGRRESATIFGTPIDCAERWLAEGAEALHVVNLDGAFGDSEANADLIRRLCRDTGIELQLGGGIRSFEDAALWLEAGVERVIIGTLAIRDPAILSRLATEFGREHIMAGVDARGGQVTIEGWEKTAGDYISWALRFEEAGAGSLLYTNVDVEGLQQGIRLEPAQRLIRTIRLPVTVAGGISSPGDVTGLKHIGAHGVVLGSALYSGLLPLKKALEAGR